MALAMVTHYSFQVGTAHDALRSQKLVNSAGGRRPPPLVEVRPSVRAQRHVVEQLADVVPHGPDSGQSCAADGGTADRGLQAPGHADAG